MELDRIMALARSRFDPRHIQSRPKVQLPTESKQSSDESPADRLGVRTDLALEAHQIALTQRPTATLPGVLSTEEDLGFGTLTRLQVQNDLGAGLIGKPIGTYSTIQVPELQARRRELSVDVAQTLAKEVERFLSAVGLGPSGSVLVVGLGNWNATPDNVGPLTTSKLLVTRHLHEYQVLDEESLGRMRPVSALSPGVLGLTGVETAEIVRGVVDRVKPDFVIVVDALASRSVDRLGTTFQLADVGINPGSGVGNTRKALTQQTLGVPVLAIGCPTVIYATTIVSEAMDRLSHGMVSSTGNDRSESPSPTGPSGSVLDPSRIVLSPGLGNGQQGAGAGGTGAAATGGSSFGAGVGHAQNFATLDAQTRDRLIHEVLGPSVGRLVVTPKEIDLMVETLSDILADALNEALHPGISAEEAAQLR